MNSNNEIWKADLHCHSVYSDGSLSVEDLVVRARCLGLKGLSLTDHDTVQGLAELEFYTKKNGLLMMPGVEFSTSFEDFSLHVLAYGFDYNHPAIQVFCQEHLDRRFKRLQKILQKLALYKIFLTEDEVLQQASLGRPKGYPVVISRVHIAQALVKKRLFKDVQSAFKSMIGDGKSASIPNDVPNLEQTLEVIHKAGGVAFVAHPHLMPRKFSIERLLQQHQIDGIEVYYARMAQRQCLPYLNLAHQRKLLMSGGSDFHGKPKPDIILGSSWTSREDYEAIVNRTYT